MRNALKAIELGRHVYGLTHFGTRTIEVAWTPDDRQGRPYAALSHELAHAHVWEATHDPDIASSAGH